MAKDIEELFEDKADEAGFCLDKKWGDYKNPYLDSNTSLAFDFFRSGFLTAENFEKQKLEGCVVVPVEPTKSMIFSGCKSINHGMTNEKNSERIYKAMLEAARGGNNGL